MRRLFDGIRRLIEGAELGVIPEPEPEPEPERDERYHQVGRYESPLTPERIPAPAAAPVPKGSLPRAACPSDAHLVAAVLADRQRVELVNDRLRARVAVLEAENAALREKANL